jgi:hypothetical protein
LGVDEALKKLWTIVDSPKTEAKEKVKAITLIKEYYRERLDLLRSEPGLVQHKQTMEFAKMSQF